MKRNATSKPFFSPEQIAAALRAAPEFPVEDDDNPPTTEADWDDAIVSHSYAELREKLAERRRWGPQKAPVKEQVAIRFSPEVLAYFHATGKGWQTRMDEALREWIAAHPQHPR